MKKIKKHEFCEYDKNHRNPKNDQKVHFLKIHKKRVFQKTPYFFEIPKKAPFYHPLKKGYFDPPKKGYFGVYPKKALFGENRVFLNMGHIEDFT